MKTAIACWLAMLLAWAAVDASAAGVETPRMRRLGVAEGLPSRMVLALAQDRQGYIWVATDDGLARYDGLQFRTWRHVPDDPASLPANSVETLLVDPLDRVWVGTNGGGLGMLDAGRDAVRQFPDVDAACRSQPWALAYAEQALWVGTSEAGICRRDERGQVTVYRADPGNPEALPSDTVYSMATDGRGRLWIGTGAGLVRMERGRFTRIAVPQLGERSIMKVSVEADGTVWAGSGSGLFRISADDRAVPAPWPKSGELRAGAVVHDRNGGYWIGSADGLFRDGDGQLRLMAGDRGSGFLTGNSGVLDILQDHEGGVWFGLINQGLAYLPPGWQRFSTFLEAEGQSLESLFMVNAAAQGRDFLVATSQGVYRLQADGGIRRVVGLDAIGKGTVRSVLPMPDGRLWLGRPGRLTIYDPASGRSQDLLTGFGEEGFKLVDLLRAAPDGSVWMSVSGGGVQHRAADGRVLDSIAFEDGRGLPEGQVEQLRHGPDGRLWVASAEALRAWTGERFEPVPGLAAGLVYDFVFVAPDTLWVARAGAIERYRWDGRALERQQRIDAAQGMPATEIGGIVAGADGSVWATTPRGMVQYLPGQPRVRVFTADDGLPDAEFSIRPPAANAYGQVLAWTASGLVEFEPARRFPPLPPSPLVIESMDVRRGDAEHAAPLSPAALPVLKAEDRDLRIAARLLSYVNPRRTRYRYRVEGYDQNWVEQDHQGVRVLSRLPAGHYRIEVQARGVENDWTPAQALDVKVLPPWWRSWPALAALALLLALLGWWAVRASRRRQRSRQEMALSKQRQELAEKASLAKTRFLATLGHEVRTPMTGVLGMSELLLDTPLQPRQRAHVESIRLAGLHLLRLVNDALDLARIEAGKLELEHKPFALRQVLEELADFMEPIAQSRGLAFERALDVPADLVVEGDATRLRQVLMNLLGNAIKFTERGSVGLAAAQDDARGTLRFAVSDTGPGINAEQQARIFQRFEQGEGARTASRYGGSGLGLAICQELAVAMQGSIHIDSQLGRGTRFTVELPLPWRLDAAMPESAPAGAAASGAPLRVLLVEDDATVAEVIVGLLASRGHAVVHAAHGLAALAETAQGSFDVGLLDLDLPGLDGFALAAQLRALGHEFPLVAVTARSDADAEQQAQAAGFEAFVRKPVTAEMLLAAIADAHAQQARQRTLAELDGALQAQQLVAGS
ncbi:ATP-binding protein [[Pseudomonas] boreopolis]|uniref:ATP-binding protein n=1 Tax=Xanthomonas boreopolis TaxID=86183 RepID=UPI003D588733